ncbi:MAG: bifunctional alpha,alpha-trehalose-phosphate synthase (UDP-forming)/trehalose-phosphatase, partial [bacterium]|nr:bifunctional alpha,alpha-trehalose-phosphate synthase (UDP-forming)/trehalose-phosphatase [bacterium]
KKHRLVMSMGNKIVEIRDPRVTKGKAAAKLLNKPYDFIMAIGDDLTDEEMYKALPKNAFSIRVGIGKTSARYRLKSVDHVHKFLGKL